MDEELELTPEKREELVKKVMDKVESGSDEEKDVFLSKNLEESIKKYILHLLYTK
jgi:hypothetical protein